MRAALALCLTLIATSAAHAFAPLVLGAPHVERLASGEALVATAVALADERVEGWPSRCSAAERLAERVARRALHGYVDTVLHDAAASPAATAAAHDTVEAASSRTGTRTLVDCAASVEVSLPIIRLREATAPWSISW